MHYLILPFQEITIKWKNLDTGKEGSASNSGVGGGWLEVVSSDTGTGPLEIAVTYTRSVLPIVGGSSIPGVYVTHTETFTSPSYGDLNACKI